MTFKANWEKTHTQYHLTDSLIKQMLSVIYPDKQIKHFEVIEGGCANINVKVDLENIALPLILRVYLRDPKAAYREQKIAQKLKGKVPIPQIYRIAEISDYTFAIAEFIPGITLRDLILNNKECDIKQIMFKVGKCLSSITAIKFDQSGFFDENLEISQGITQAGLIEFCTDTLNDKNVQSVLSAAKRQQVGNLIKVYGHLLPDGTETNLVHADFDPANILVNEINGAIEITGILDWEFSFAGSTLSDVANMLRYAHHMPKGYQDSFLKGLTSSGFELLDNWQTTVNMLNLLSLLDCIKRSDPQNRPNQVIDIIELINHILFDF